MRTTARRVTVVLGAAAALSGCEPKREPPRQPWTPQHYGATPYYATRGPDPYGLPGGSEARDPWSARPTTAPSPTPPLVADTGPFLVLTSLQGPDAAQREPTVNALIARLGGVRRATSLWEMTPQPGGGVGSVAAALETVLCAEDVVVLYRARNQALERTEFAGQKVCAPAASPPSPPPAPPKQRPPADPMRSRF